MQKPRISANQTCTNAFLSTWVGMSQVLCVVHVCMLMQVLLLPTGSGIVGPMNVCVGVSPVPCDL